MKIHCGVVARGLMAGALLFAGAAQAGMVQMLITNGTPVPDGQSWFSGFGLPAINDQRQVVVRASVSDGTPTSDNGVFMARPGQPILQLARQAEVTPDGVSAFNSLSDKMAVDAAGRAIIIGSLNAPPQVSVGSGIFISTNIHGGVVQLAREGQSNGFGNWPAFTSGLIVGFNHHSQIGFASTLTGPGLNSTNNQYLFRLNTTNQTVTEIARTGQPVPGEPGWFAILQRPSLNQTGQLAFVADLVGTAIDAHRGIYRGDGNQLVEIARQARNGTYTNGFFDEVSNANTVPINDLGEVAFRALFYVGGDRLSGVFCGNGGSIREIARSGDSVPGMTNKISAIPISVTLNNRGEAAFFSSLTGYDTSARALLRGNGVTLKTIARVGQMLPGGNDWIDWFPSQKHSLNHRGQILFMAKLGSGVDALLLHDDTLGLLEIMRIGQPVLNGTVAGIDFSGTLNSDSVSRERSALNNHGDVAFLFTVGSVQHCAVWIKPEPTLAANLVPPQSINLTFTALPGRTHYVQACDLTFQFTDLSGPIVNAGSVALPTNYLDWNALTNDPARFYRLRIVD